MTKMMRTCTKVALRLASFVTAVLADTNNNGANITVGDGMQDKDGGYSIFGKQFFICVGIFLLVIVMGCCCCGALKTKSDSGEYASGGNLPEFRVPLSGDRSKF